MKALRPILGIAILGLGVAIGSACGTDDTAAPGGSSVIPEPTRTEMTDHSRTYQPGQFKEATQRALAVKENHNDLLWRQPNAWALSVGILQDAEGNETGEMGIIVHVTQKLDQAGLPIDDRIPPMLDGVAVEIREGPNFIIR